MKILNIFLVDNESCGCDAKLFRLAIRRWLTDTGNDIQFHSNANIYTFDSIFLALRIMNSIFDSPSKCQSQLELYFLHLKHFLLYDETVLCVAGEETFKFIAKFAAAYFLWPDAILYWNRISISHRVCERLQTNESNKATIECEKNEKKKRN